MAKARVLDVGQCDPDHAGIRGMINDHFDVHVDRVMFVDQAMPMLAAKPYDLVLVNRLIFADQSDGMELVRRMKADAATAGVPVMVISNFADAQDRAVAAGAVRGFGKARLNAAETLQLLAHYLPAKTAGARGASGSSPTPRGGGAPVPATKA